jgi:DUF2934 family protein
MGARQSPDSRIAQTWRRYREAFENFREKVRNVQNLALLENRDQATIDTAVLEMEMAKEHYNTARDALFLEMAPFKSRRVAPPENGWREKGIRELAELLWELEGKPEGSALDDWYRAEDIYRRTSRAPV